MKNDGIPNFGILIRLLTSIRLIENIFIPLSFHWKTFNDDPDWNIRLFLRFNPLVQFYR